MIEVCRADELDEGEAVRFVADVPVSVFRAEGEFYAVDDTCSHSDASLADGFVEGCFVECPLHAALFDLRTGVPQCLPAKRPIRTHPVFVVEGVVYVQVNAAEEVA